MTSTAGVYWVHRTSAKGDGTTDDSSPIQDLIDTASAANGGIVYFQAGKTYACNLTLKDNVMLVGMGAVPKMAQIGSKLIAAGTGAVIDTPDGTTISNCGISGLHIYGLGAGTAVKGVRFRQVTRGILSNFTIEQCSDEGILLDHNIGSTLACFISNGLVQGCLLNQTRTEKSGVCDIGGTDHWIENIEATASVSGSLTSSNAYCGAWRLRGSTFMMRGCIGEISDYGFYLDSNPGINHFIACRADLNMGNGWEIAGQRNMFSGSLAWRNSRDTHNTYSGFKSLSTARLNLFSACFSGGLGSDTALAQKYGFEDLVTATSGRNVYVGCRGSNNATNEHYIDGAGADSATSTTSWT